MEKQTFLNLLKKKEFVDRVSYAISGQERISVANVDYQVWVKNDKPDYYVEVLKITYNGGAYAIRSVFATSQSAIFKEIGDLIEGGYYRENRGYDEMVISRKYTQIIGNDITTKKI